MTGLSTLKAYLWCIISPYMILSAMGHLSDIVLPLKAKLNGDVPNLDGCGDQIDCKELTESVPNLEEFLEDLEL